MKEFVVGFRFNERFSNLVAANFTVEGTGAAVILGAYLAGCIMCLIAGLVFAAVGASLLLMDLGNPINAWRSILNPRKSWISKGALFFIGLLVISFLYASSSFLREGQIGFLMQLLGILFSVLIMLYTGFLLKSMAAIPFWNRSIIPLIFLSHSLTSGLFVTHALLWIFQIETSVNFIILEFLFLIINVLLIAIHLLSLPTHSKAAQESLNRIIGGQLKSAFLGGGVFLGIMVPLALIIASDLKFINPGGSEMWILVAVVSRLIGDFFLRSSYLKSGVYESLY